MKKFFVAALAVLALVGCRDQKQSELDFEAKAGKATVSGTVTYDYGYETIDGALIKAKKSLEQGTIIAKVAYKEYDDEAKGIKQIEAEIKDGKFTIEVPVTMKEVAVDFDIRGFYAKHYGQLDNAGKPIEQDAFYEAPAIPQLSLISNDVKVLDEIVMAPKAEELTTRTQKLTLKGTIYGEFEKKKLVDDEDAEKGYYGIKDNQKLSKVALVITLSNTKVDAEGNKVDTREIVYNTTCNEAGEYELNCDFYTAWGTLSDVEVKVEAKAFAYELTHYYAYYDKEESECKYTSQKVAGYYNDAKSKAALDGGAMLLGKTLDVNMAFVPLSTDKVYGLGNAIDTADDNKQFTHAKLPNPPFNANPMGW